MTMEPRDAAEAIARQRRQQEEAKEALRTVFGDQEGWRRLASGSFSKDVGGARAVVAPAPSQGFLCNIRVGSRIVPSATLDTPQEALEYVNQVKEQLSGGA